MSMVGGVEIDRLVLGWWIYLPGSGWVDGG
jgi:hypothetical protein